ncbi:hypothetical protein Tco_0550054, partial [Tanacetum coccineum]
PFALVKGIRSGSALGLLYKSVLYHESEPVKEPIAKVFMDDAGDDVARNDNQTQDTSEPKIRKTPNQNGSSNLQCLLVRIT